MWPLCTAPGVRRRELTTQSGMPSSLGLEGRREPGVAALILPISQTEHVTEVLATSCDWSGWPDGEGSPREKRGSLDT